MLEILSFPFSQSAVHVVNLRISTHYRRVIFTGDKTACGPAFKHIHCEKGICGKAEEFASNSFLLRRTPIDKAAQNIFDKSCLFGKCIDST